jgi:hypothetical protein
MKHLIIFLFFSIGLNAQTATKWRVYEKWGTVEFVTKAEATAYCNGCDSVVAVVFYPDAEFVADSIKVAKKNEQYATIKTAAQSAVGIKYDALSITQVRALYGIVLFKEGAIDSVGKIKPLKDWVKN